MFLFIQPFECFIHIFLSRADLRFCWGKRFSPDLDQGQTTRLCADGRIGGKLQSPEARRERRCCLFQVQCELASWVAVQRGELAFLWEFHSMVEGLYWSVQFSKKVKTQKPTWLELRWTWNLVICFQPEQAPEGVLWKFQQNCNNVFLPGSPLATANEKQESACRTCGDGLVGSAGATSLSSRHLTTRAQGYHTLSHGLWTYFLCQRCQREIPL